MKTRLVKLLACGVILGASVLAAGPIYPSKPVKEKSPADIVYVTKSGKRYHSKDCRYVKNATECTRGEAEEKGLLPCKFCKP
jgi:hypothetical protein